VTSSPVELDGIWLFDGLCNFCSGSVKTVLKLDPRGDISFVPLQSPFGHAIAARYGLDIDNPESFPFFDRGQPLGASDAVLALARRLGFPLRAVGVLRIAPKRWRDAAYGALARNRYRLMGKRETCMVPTLEQRSRFVLEPPKDWM
jgi:predicted DCC family thiol-disulfide oxidoreductase YuxK